MISSLRGGGSEQQVLLLLRHLDRQRFEPHLYLVERTGDLLAEVPSDVGVHAFDDVPMRKRVYVPGAVFRDQIRHLEQVIGQQRIDVIYDRTFHMTMIAGGVRQRHVPRVSTIVSPPEQAFPLVEHRFRWWKHRRLASAYRRSSRVVAVSDLAAQSAARFYSIDRRRIETIANPVDSDRVRRLAEEPAPERDGRLTLVCVGRMTAEKGHRDLISALELLETESAVAPICLWFVGDGPLRSELEQRSRDRLHRHEIKFLARLANPAPAIATADALVLPSHFEGMPNVVLEAYSLSTPVIATRSGGTVELERDEPTVLWAEPRQPHSLARAIKRFAINPSKFETHVQAATRLIQAHHDVDSTVRRIEQLLSQSNQLGQTVHID